jgi:phosphatidylserine/phosphatidylglycerophosphate/cardiolipin synthase-like enzyme
MQNLTHKKKPHIGSRGFLKEDARDCRDRNTGDKPLHFQTRYYLRSQFLSRKALMRPGAFTGRLVGLSPVYRRNYMRRRPARFATYGFVLFFCLLPLFRVSAQQDNSQNADSLTQSAPPLAAWEVGFSPSNGALSVVLDAIHDAKVSLHVAAYEFTNKLIAKELIAAAARGVTVQVVADYKASLERYSQIPALKQAGIPVRLDACHLWNITSLFVLTRYTSKLAPLILRNKQQRTRRTLSCYSSTRLRHSARRGRS